MHRAKASLPVAIAIVLMLAAAALAIPPRLISYQGRVTDNLGNPMTANGVSFRFLIYPDSTGGSFMWAEVTQKDVVDGLVTHNLGSLVNLPDSLFMNYDALWLEILINGEANQPRTRLVGAPRTASINGSSGGTVTGDVLVLTVSPNNALASAQFGLGRAGRFSIDNPLNTSEAVVGITQGAGTAGYFQSVGGGSGVKGFASGDGWSLYGSGGLGVYGVIDGSDDSTTAVRGVITSASAGLYSAALRGQNLGIGTSGIGVWGSHNNSGWGVYGTANGTLGTGVRGTGGFYGVYGFSENGTAIAAVTNGGVAGSFDGGQVTIEGGTDASLANGGFLVIGPTNGLNVVVDNNEIMARSNGADTILHLQAEGGAVAIGAQSLNIPAGYILAVDGKAIMEEVEVQLSNAWPDYVFEEDYELMPLDELEAHVRTNKHLPGIPTAESMDGGSVPLGEMQTKLLEKIEELTLHVIAVKKEVDRVSSENEQLRRQLAKLAPASTGKEE